METLTNYLKVNYWPADSAESLLCGRAFPRRPGGTVSYMSRVHDMGGQTGFSKEKNIDVAVEAFRKLYGEGLPFAF